MADYNIGDVTARLTADASQFQRTIQQAIQALQQLSQATAQARQAQATNQQATNQLATAYTATTQAVRQQAQAYAQAHSASLAFRRAQDEQRQATRAAREEMQAAAAAARQTGSAWQSMLTVAGGIGIATTIQGIVSQMVSLAQSTVTVGVQFQQLRASLATVTGGITQGAQAFAFILETSNRYGLALQSTAEQYRRLSAATRNTAAEGELTRQLFTTLAAASLHYGMTTEQTGRALVAFEQILSKGRISQEELRGQLAEALPGALQIAARAYSVTTAELGKMIEKGIESTEFTRRFVQQLQTELPQGVTHVERAAQAFNRLGNEIVLLKDAIAQSGLVQFLAAAASGMANLLKANREAEAQRGRFLQTRTTEAMGGVQMSEADAAKALAITEELTQAEEQLRRGQEARRQSSLGILTPLVVTERQLTELQQRIDALRQEQTELKAVAVLRQQARQGLAARESFAGGDPLREQQERAKAIEAANTRLQDVLRASHTEMEKLNARARESPELFGQLGATAEQGLRLVDNRLKILRDELEKTTEAILQRQKEPGVPTQDLLKQQQDLRQELAKTEAQRKAIADAEQARQKTLREGVQDQERAASRLIELQTTLARVQHFLGAPDQDRAAAARSAAAQRGSEIEGAIKRSLETLQDSPALRQLGPALTGQFQQALAQLPDIVARQGQTAFDRVQRELATQLTQRRTAMEADLARVQTFLGRPEQTPAEEARARVQQQGADIQAMLQRNIAALESDPELQALSETLLQPFRDALQRLPDVVAAEGEQAYEQVLERSALEPLRKLAAQYSQTKEARDRDTASMEAATLSTTKYAGEAQRLLEVIETGIAQRQTQGLQAQLARLQTPRDLSTAGRLRAEAGVEGRSLTREDEAILRQIEDTERLLNVMSTVEQAGVSAASAITSALMTLGDQTQKVGQAFARMAQNILQSTAQILLNEGFRALIRLGLGALTSAFMPVTPMSVTPGGGAYQGAAGGGVPFLPPPVGFQHGGIVTRPTLALVGENAATNPEYVFNRQQMQGLMRSSPLSGGGPLGGGVVVMNFPGRQAAEEEAGRQRSLGHQVVMNEIMSDLQRGESSQINRMLRTLQR